MEFKKEIGLLGVFSIASGAMISSGIFILPGLAFGKAGPAVVISYILAGILVLPALFATVELLSAMPKTGGDYFYISRSMGPFAGFLAGLANWFSLASKSAFALVGIGAFTVLIHPSITEALIDKIAVLFCIIFMLINLKGVDLAEKIQIALVLFLIAILGFYILGSIESIRLANYGGFFSKGWNAIFSTAGFVFVSYAGITKVASVAGEVKNPGKNIPLGMLLAWGVVIILYALAVFVTIGLLDGAELSGSLTPLCDGAKIFAGRVGLILLAFAGMMAFFTTANAGIMTASRGPYAMSLDNLMPRGFVKMNKNKVPYITIILTSLYMILLILFLNLENLVKVASTLLIILYIFANLSLIFMRESRVLNYKPVFKAPLYPYIYIIAIVFYLLLILEMGSVALKSTGIFLLAASLFYFVYPFKVESKKSALVHTVERILGKEISSAPALGVELKDILIERDEIVRDRFDNEVKSSRIFDIEEKLTFEEFIRILAQEFSKQTGLSEEKLFSDFTKREQLSSTVIRPGLAVPHIVIKGSGIFKMVLSRIRQGVEFPAVPEPVKTVFAIIVSSDERNFYLRALMAIAEIVQEKDFEKNWLAASSKRELEDIILLAARKRDEVLRE